MSDTTTWPNRERMQQAADLATLAEEVRRLDRACADEFRTIAVHLTNSQVPAILKALEAIRGDITNLNERLATAGL